MPNVGFKWGMNIRFVSGGSCLTPTRPAPWLVPLLPKLEPCQFSRRERSTAHTANARLGLAGSPAQGHAGNETQHYLRLRPIVGSIPAHVPPTTAWALNIDPTSLIWLSCCHFSIFDFAQIATIPRSPLAKSPGHMSSIPHADAVIADQKSPPRKPRLSDPTGLRQGGASALLLDERIDVYRPEPQLPNRTHPLRANIEAFWNFFNVEQMVAREGEIRDLMKAGRH